MEHIPDFFEEILTADRMATLLLRLLASGFRSCVSPIVMLQDSIDPFQRRSFQFSGFDL